MRIFFLALCLLATGFFLRGQAVSGIVVYQSARQTDFELKSQEVAPAQKKQIKQMMQQYFQKEYTLRFTPTESYYREQEKLQKEGQLNLGGFAGMFGSSSERYKNLSTDTTIAYREFFSRKFRVGSKPPSYQWKLTQEQKSIGRYTCYKATIEKEVERQTMTMRDNELSDTTVIDTQRIEAWYTPQIPVSNGPSIYHGLPGLILEVHDDGLTLLAKSVTLNPKEPVAPTPPNEGKPVTEAEYNTIRKKKLQEMKEMYQGQGGGKGSRMKFTIPD